MKIKAALLSLIMVAHLVACSPAVAATLTFVPDPNGITGSIEVFAPTAKIGRIPLPRGRVVIKGNRVEVTVIPEWQFDRHVVLEGPVLHTESNVSGNGGNVRGVAFFNGGEWLSYVDNPRKQETVTTATEEFRGRILNISDTAVELRNTAGQVVSIPIGDIQDIDSPRSYNFNIPIVSTVPLEPGRMYQAETRLISFVADDAPFRLAAIKRAINEGDGDLSTAQLVAIGTGVSLVQLAQLIPVMVVPLTRNSFQRAAYFKQLQVTAEGIFGPQLLGL